MEESRRRSRRRFLAAAGAAGAVALAGCTAEQVDEEADDRTDGGSDDGGSDDGEEGGSDEEASTLTVATYSSFIDAPSSSPGPWLAETFEEEYGIEIEWATPENGVNHYIERRNAGADIDADLFVGLNVDDLVRIDDGADDPLFEAGALADVDGLDDVQDGLWFDPRDRVVPYATNYISLVYDGTATTAPETFEGLLDADHGGALITQNPSGSTTGRAFLLHTVHRFGADDQEGSGSDVDHEDYLDYWAALQENDVRVQGSWDDAYAAWSGGEAPMVVSYSTDQVFAAAEGADLEEHQVRFLDDQAYANPEGAAVFADADEPDLAREFLSFLLSPRVQGEIAELNVQFPATTTADLAAEYDELAKEPPDPVTFTYEELQGSVDGWIDAWERQFAEN
ncbi:thiamine ABC transporter substrate-binding protein [Halorubrum vacuolatum]|uniref:Thiamine transport system substrate-binding protein n=1 Tax=Halorubrum vacuolatum TaxID=63740 RepID=A0A238WCV7_HALVU|nr:thiamine ABC transporter substrate-binding protein [Halorubrum vacuolatum]SNR44416.1 thiamine transport system substrate-binding protein [Halorubrum vacuolatum]